MIYFLVKLICRNNLPIEVATGSTLLSFIYLTSNKIYLFTTSFFTFKECNVLIRDRLKIFNRQLLHHRKTYANFLSLLHIF